MRASIFSLAAFEIAVRGAGAALVGREDVGVHADAHAAARVAPFKSGFAEYFVEAFFFGLRLDAARAGDDQRLLDALRDVLAGNEVRGGAKIVEPGIGAGADEDAVDGNIHNGCSGFKAHVLERALGGFLIVEILEVVRVGNARGDAGNHARVGAPGDLRSDVRCIEFDLHIEMCAAVTFEQFPPFDGFLESFSTGNKGASFEVGESGFIGGHHAGAGAAFDGHVANGHAAVHREGTNGFAAVFSDMAGAAADADFADDGEDEVLGGDAAGALAVDEDVQRLRSGLHQALRGEDVFDFAGADAEGQRAECAVGGGVTVAANEGLAGLGDAQLGADDMHDALVLAVHVEKAHAGFAAVLFEGFKLELGVLIEDGQSAVRSGDGVVHHGEGEIGAANFAAFGAQAGESLGRSAFVNEVAVDIDKRRLVRGFMDDVGVPDFLVERFWCHGRSTGF